MYNFPAMKLLFLSISTLLFTTIAAQTPPDMLPPVEIPVEEVKIEEEDGKVFTRTEVPVTYPGSDKELLKYIEINLNKQLPLEKGAPKGEHVVTIKFIVRKDGSSYNFYPVTKAGYGMEEEVIRLIKSIKWIPAKQNNHKVTAYQSLTVVFNL